MKNLIFIFLLMLSTSVLSQDSIITLSYEDYMEIVMEHHPYAYQANIVRSMGDSKVLESRGAFDPKLFGNANQKYFDDKQYYSHIQSGLKIPTWFGLTAESGFDMNDGAFLNPESRLPNNGLWYAGIRLELGNGLIIDERRAQLNKAKLLQTSTQYERTILLNQLRRDASIAYYKWQQSFQKARVYQLAYENASIRLNAVKQAALYGDRPYIDTVEASINLQNRELSLKFAENELRNAKLKLEIYLWSEGFVPLEIQDAIPEQSNTSDTLKVPIVIDSVISDHPFIQINDLQFEQLLIDLRLKKEQLKPKLTLKYNAISEPVGGNLFAEYSPSNYTWGATFEYPILTRKERAGVQLAKLKLQEQELKINMVEAELNYNIKSIRNNYLTAMEQLETMRKFVENNRRLYDSERTLFNLGESSLFMINSRENQWLKSNIQLFDIENQCKQLQTELEYYLLIYKD